MARTTRGGIVAVMLICFVLTGLGGVQAAGPSAPAQQGQEPAYMVLEGTFEGAIASSDVCVICLPPVTSGSLRLELDWRSGQVTGQLEGTGAGSATGTACEGEAGETFSGSGEETVDGPLNGSLNVSSGTLSFTGTLNYVGTTVCTDNCEEQAGAGSYDYVDEVPFDGTVSKGGQASGTFSWSDPPCSFAAEWEAQAISISYDSDGDGLLDEEDQCPTLASALADGCPEVIPDSDGDGLTDDVDACPQEHGLGADGCQPPVIDTDGDGVVEEKDNCPGRYGEQSDGCPEDRGTSARLANQTAVGLILRHQDDPEALDGWSDLTPTQQDSLIRLLEAVESMYQPEEEPETAEGFLAALFQDLFDSTDPASTAEVASPPAATTTSLPPTVSPPVSISPEASQSATNSNEDMGAPGFSLADQIYQQAQEREQRRQQQELEVAQQLVQLQQDRQTIIRIVNDERYRQKFGDAYDLYRGTRDLIVPAIKKGGQWLQWIEDPEAAAMAAVQAWEKEQLKNGVNQALRDQGILYGPEAEIMTMEDVAIKAYDFVEHAATVPSLIHYGYYQEVYQQAVDEGDSPADAHEWALDKLRTMMRDPTDEFMAADASRFTRAWNPSASHNEELFQVYDEAFQRLNSMSIKPGVNR